MYRNVSLEVQNKSTQNINVLKATRFDSWQFRELRRENLDPSNKLTLAGASNLVLDNCFIF